MSEAFARSFPELPAEAKALAATEAARVAVVLGVPGIAVMDIVCVICMSTDTSGGGD